jgi:hypothetical protein
MATLKKPITVFAAARALRLRYQVTLRLIKSGKLRGQRIGARYFADATDLARVRRTRPWAPWAARRVGI